jgi:hypothetical protein
MKHIIARQILEVQVPSEKDAAMIRRKISTIYKRKIVPLIESCCDQYGSPEKTYRIDRIELDLGKIDINKFEEQFSHKTAQEFKKTLAKKIQAVNAKSPKEPEKKKKASDAELLEHFIKTGAFPWWAKAEKKTPEHYLQSLIKSNPEQLKTIIAKSFSNKSWFKRLVYQFSDKALVPTAALFSTMPAEYFSGFDKELEEVFASPAFDEYSGQDKKHMKWQAVFSTLLHSSVNQVNKNVSQLQNKDVRFKSSVKNVIEGFIKKTQSNNIQVQNLESLIKSNPEQLKAIIAKNFSDKSYFKRLVYQFSDKALAQTAGLLSTMLADYFTAFDKELEKIFENTSFSSYSRPNKRHIKWQAVFSTLLNDSVTLINKNDSDSKKSQKENFKSSVKKLISKSLHKAEKNGLEQRDYHKQKPEENFEQIDDNIIKKTITKKSRADEADAYYIENSGLVVLWPFLNNFFQNSGLVENNQFISFEAQERGALLLQYIADGSEKASEQLMPLNKILCGIDIEAPINLELEISEKEKTESENLIAVLIERWIALKNMSPESVKSIFIRRQGIIKRNPGNWFIQVEKKPPDILLNKLPWSISVIKLPWRNDLIYVQW